MKKAFYAMFAVLGMYACSTMDETQNPPTASEKTELGAPMSVIRTPEEASACAMEAFAHFYGTSRSVKIVKDVKPIASRTMGRSAAADTSYYIVNLEDNEGYAVIAADRRYPNTILAVTEKGNVEHPDSIDNPGAAMFFEGLDYAINGNFERDCTPIDSSTIILPNPDWSGGDINPWLDTPQYKWETTTQTYSVEPRVPFNWGQIYPEGVYFKNKKSGCGTTASVLLLSYFEIPRYISSDKFGFKKVDWSLIKEHKRSYSIELNYELPLKEPADEALAELCYELGKRNNSVCHKDGTSTNIENVRSALLEFRTLGFNPRPICAEMPRAYYHLGDGVIYVRGETDKGEGHAFIVDGYKHVVITRTQYKREPRAAEWYAVDKKQSVDSYNHINWGWCGADNGYFLISVFDTSKAEEYDNGTTTIEHYKYTKKFKYFVVTKN